MPKRDKSSALVVMAGLATALLSCCLGMAMNLLLVLVSGLHPTLVQSLKVELSFSALSVLRNIGRMFGGMPRESSP